jgi:hypothetical protein
VDNQAEKEPNRPAKPVEQRVELRASDADRERVVGWLRDAFAEGRLTMDEHAERVDAAYAARTQGELVPLTRDLPVHQEHVAQTEGASRPAARPEVERAYGPDAGDGPATKIVAIFGGAERKGRWRVGSRITAVAILGGVEIDLTEATFTSPELVIHCTAIMGGISIKLPENVTLRGGGVVGIMGGSDVKAFEAPDPGAPVVRVDGFAFWGGVEAKAKRGKKVADWMKKAQKRIGD